MVFSIAYHFLQDRAAAEELAQDVFLKLYRHFAELESPEHVTFWLRKVTSNHCIDAARRRKLRSFLGLGQAPEPSVPPQQGDPLRSELLQRLVASLPEKSRILIVLRYQEEMELEEIVRVLDLPLSTVKSQLQRALAMLREKAERTMGENPL
jgi:RNA polymerase sigma-70 factor (ECF subfamily)